MINKHKSNKIKENSNTVRHLNNGTDHRHSKSCCDQSSLARRTKILCSSLSVRIPYPLMYCSIHMKMMEESGGHLVCSRQVWLPVVLIGQTMWCTTGDLDIHTTRWCACFVKGSAIGFEYKSVLCKKFCKQIPCIQTILQYNNWSNCYMATYFECICYHWFGSSFVLCCFHFYFHIFV